jgi:acetyl-CoA carboxylase carboxyltransferase component
MPSPPLDGAVAVTAPLIGTVVSVLVAEGDGVRAGQAVVILESMKMEHLVAAEVTGVVAAVAAGPGDTVEIDQPLLWLTEGEIDHSGEDVTDAVDLDHIRPDLADVLARQAKTLDAARPEAIAKHHAVGHRSARENVEDLCDPGTFVEYGSLMVAAQRRRRTVEDLIDRTPGDGMVAGIGHVNGDRFGPDRSRCVAMSYDYTVLAGTQGHYNHLKKDRMFELAERNRLPVVLFAEGGGGRPGDTDVPGVAGLDVMAFYLFGRLSGLVPLVGVVAGRCFAGNAVLLGCCDVIIATQDTNLGIGGPAMVEGGGLGVFRPEEIGPMDVQVPDGVVDIAVADETEAVAVAKQYLSYFQGPVADWQCADQRLLRHAIPENRLRIYDVRAVIELMADTGSVLEIRRGFGPGMVTALARIEGNPIGIVANNPSHRAGAVDTTGADKAARFLQLCDAFDIPVLFLCDTPGIMVGPEAEKEATVRHAARLFVIGANLSVPFFTIILRKAYGLGAQAMAGGTFKAPAFTISWPTGEFGGMGLEGSVQLGFRKELEAIADPEEREREYQRMVAQAYERGKALNMAMAFEIDDVIDPAETRARIMAGLRSAPPAPPRQGKKRPCIDTW